MKVIHVLKKIEALDQDIKELRKLEKSLERNKAFTAPIFMTIEKQINILLADRIKMLELDIKNPPQSLLNDIEEEPAVEEEAPAALSFNKAPKKQNKPAQAKTAVKSKKESKTEKQDSFDDDMDDIPVPMMTQDVIDKKFNEIKKENPKPVTASKNDDDDTSVKLLDIALEKGTLDKGTVQHEKEKRRIRFFRDNFPGGEY
ncbi:MAG TPA: hypothetical protein PLE16_03350 [Spirochaetota bacterium]|jgi:hypothetical protein|nr:hypothetical protein [Spirochaetota bacterium]HOH36373.1 hypothetical protein [Spirochaetota bacterium]HPA64479.1 hypothetical protein [Spirochaetota bacterium]HPM33618.1 hypothetical protein [Spirochaetota bacterium]